MTKKRILAWVLTLLMLMNFMPMNVLAEGQADAAPSVKEWNTVTSPASKGVEMFNVDVSEQSADEDEQASTREFLVKSGTPVGKVMDVAGIDLEDKTMTDDLGNVLTRASVITRDTSITVTPVVPETETDRKSVV